MISPVIETHAAVMPRKYTRATLLSADGVSLRSIQLWTFGWMYVFAIWSSMNAKSFRSLCRIGANSRFAIAILVSSGRSMGNEV
jgi:hypothetical protein